MSLAFSSSKPPQPIQFVFFFFYILFCKTLYKSFKAKNRIKLGTQNKCPINNLFQKYVLCIPSFEPHNQRNKTTPPQNVVSKMLYSKIIYKKTNMNLSHMTNNQNPPTQKKKEDSKNDKPKIEKFNQCKTYLP